MPNKYQRKTVSVRELVAFATSAAERESIFLTPFPRHELDLEALIDWICEVAHIPTEVMSKMVDEVQGIEGNGR